MRPDRRALHPDLRRVPLPSIPFHWRWALPLWRWGTAFARPVPRAGVDVMDHAEAGVPVRVYRPHAAASGGALLWLHGGGLIVGRPSMDDGQCVGWARELGLLVVSVDYRLAPEHPFPAALDDAHGAWTWLQGAAAAMGVDPARVAVGGGSAGGGLAACLAQRLRDEGGARPAAQMLVYPMLDDRTAARRELDEIGHRVWTNRSNRAGWSAYLGDAPGAADVPPYAAAARCADLAGLPPAWIGVGALDLFLDEDRAYAARLRGAGVATELHEVPGAPHGFDALAPDVPLARAFMARARRRSCRSTLGPSRSVADPRRDVGAPFRRWRVHGSCVARHAGRVSDRPCGSRRLALSSSMAARRIVTAPSDAPHAHASDAPRSDALTPSTYLAAVDLVAASDPVLADVAERWGPPPFWRHPAGFAGLAHGILAQQVSLESAVATFCKLEAALGRVEPETFLTLDDARLRAIGFSRQKAAYVRGLALAIAVQELWHRPARPAWDALDAFAQRWRPYRAVAARFLWHDYLARRGRQGAGPT